MSLTIRQLLVFEAVARHLSFTRAAEELKLTQPAVSMQVKQLEESAGLPLFEQIGKKIFLTEAGREMYRCARAVGSQLAETEQVFEDLRGTKRGHIHVAVATTANYFATRMLVEFCRQHEGITFSLDVTNRETLIRRLEGNEVDIVIMGRPPQGLGVVAEAFMDNPLVVIAAPDHPLARRRAVPLADLARESFVVRETGSGTRIAMERFFSDHGIHPSLSMEIWSNEAIKQAVQAGLGLGVVSAHTIELEVDAGQLVVVDAEAFPIQRHWYVVYREGKRLAPVAQAFRDFVLDRSRALAAQGGAPGRRAK